MQQLWGGKPLVISIRQALPILDRDMVRKSNMNFRWYDCLDLVNRPFQGSISAYETFMSSSLPALHFAAYMVLKYKGGSYFEFVYGDELS